MTSRIFYSLFTNPIFLSAIFSWFIAQLMKTVIRIFRKRSSSTLDVIETILWTTGGMPSSHSAAVTGLTTSIGFEVGITSPIFISMFFYGIIVIRDALGVRRATGLQAKALNHIGAQLNKQHGIDYKPVKEIHGHTVSEVSVGTILGFFIAVAFCNL